MPLWRDPPFLFILPVTLVDVVMDSLRVGRSELEIVPVLWVVAVAGRVAVGNLVTLRHANDVGLVGGCRTRVFSHARKDGA
jgi:hypothetical protein